MDTPLALNDFELQIEEAGKNLQQLPCSDDELLIRLNKLEDLLIKVAQAPPPSMQGALLPSMKALISDDIFSCSDEKVNISVISCIHEITRITAPDAPYNDEQMKAIFEKTVEAFKRLADESGFFFAKAVSILDNVARVRSCLMMLDLECDAAVVDMFHHFLKVIRPNHPHNVFLSIEAILIMILEESEEISMDLLHPLLESVRKENEARSHISWTLGEKVMKKCASKLKPYVKKGVKSMAIKLDAFTEIVTSVCQNEPEPIHCDDLDGSGEKQEEEKPDLKKDAKDPSLDGTDVLAPNEASPHIVPKIADVTQNSEIGNDSHPTPNEKTHKKKSKTVKKEKFLKQQTLSPQKKLKSNGARGNSEPNNLESATIVQPNIEPDSVPKKRGRKPNSLMNPEEGYDNTWICGGRKVAKSAQKRKSSEKDITCSPCENPVSKKVSVSPKSEKVSDAPVSQPESCEDGDAGGSVLRSQAPPNGIQRKRGRPKKTSMMNQNASPNLLSESREKPLVDNTPMPSNDCLATDLHNSKDLGVKHHESSRKTSVTVETDVKTSDRDENKSQVQKVSMRKAKVDVNLRKVLPEASATKSETTHTSPRSSYGDESPMQETPKSEVKRKVIAGKVETSDTAELGEQLVGKRVKVWWPMDKIFYEGVIDAYDPSKRKHKVLYLDGDQETLNLRKQRWLLIADDVSSDSDRAINVQKQDPESVVPLKKKRKTMSEPAKKANSVSSSKSAGRIVKSVKKGGGKSFGNSALGKSLIDDNEFDGGSKDDLSGTFNDQKSSGKLKFKKLKKVPGFKKDQS